MPTSVASSSKLKHNKNLQNTPQHTHKKTLKCFIKIISQKHTQKTNKQQKKSRLEGMNYTLTWSATKTKNSKKGKKT